MPATIGDYLRELRTTRRLSLSQLAERSAVSRRTLCYWEANAHTPCLAELEGIFTAIGASVSEQTQALALINKPRAARQLRARSTPNASQEIGPMPSGGDLLRALRQRRGLPVETTAAALGVSTATISRWETGRVVPDADRLDALLTLLGAQEGERAALKEGYRFLSAPLREAALSASTLQERFDVFMQRHYDAPDDRLDALNFLSFEAQAWPVAMKNDAGRRLLALVCANYAAFLAASAQMREAGRYAYRALDLQTDRMKDSSQIRGAIILAQSEVFRGNRPAPERGLQMLQVYRSAADISPLLKAWILADMAEYLARQSKWEAALQLGQEACRVAERAPDGGDLRFRQLDLAKIELGAGRAERALSLITLKAQDGPGRRAGIELLLVQTLLALEERNDAQIWLERANADLAACDMMFLRHWANGLARQL